MNSTLAKAVFGVGVALAIASIASIYITMVATQNQRTTDALSSQQTTSSNSRITTPDDTNQKDNNMNATGTLAGRSTALSSLTITIPQGAANQQVQNYYQPNPASLSSVQTRITWINKDSAPHTATADDNSFDTGTIAVGSSGSATIKGSSSSIQYHCTFHPWMKATLQVAS
jgi:plastocyanin